MTALEQARGRLALIRTAVSEADLERADLLLSELEDDLRRMPLDALLEDHACTNCGSDCNAVLALQTGRGGARAGRPAARLRPRRGTRAPHLRGRADRREIPLWGGSVSEIRCLLCQEPGEAFCQDFVACNYRSRIRIGLPVWQARRWRARDLRTYPRANGGRR